jgi:pyridinium-3,5-biscarboxylic acid mononucleotide synthase
MDNKQLENLIDGIRSGKVSTEAALQRLKKLPFEDLGYAKVDHHRYLRNGVPEVIYCAGKTEEQIKGIVETMIPHHSNILATRAENRHHEAILSATPDCQYHAAARIVVVKPRPVIEVGRIAVVCAGTSDIPVAEEAVVTAATLGNRVDRLYDVGVAGLHRLLNSCEDLFKANVAIVIAGMEGALASVVGGLVSCPVIGVPTSVGYGASFGGIAALLSMLNSCASGVSVVNIDNGFGAGYQANLINKIAVGHGSREDQPHGATEQKSCALKKAC